MHAIALVDAHSRARGAARSVLNRLALHAEEGTNLAWPTNTKLAGETGLSERHVSRAIAELVTLGEIVRQPHQNRRRMLLVTPDAPHQITLLSAGDPDRMSYLNPHLTLATLGSEGDTHTRAGRKDKKDINNTPQTPQRGPAPDLVSSWSTSTRRRRRSRGQHPTAPPPGEPCPGAQPKLAASWSAIEAALREAEQWGQWEVWGQDAHPHELRDGILVVAFRPAVARWVQQRWAGYLKGISGIPVGIVGCAELEEVSR